MLFSRRVKLSAHSFLPKIFVSILCAGLSLAPQSPAANRTSARPSAQSTPQFEALPLVRSRQNHLLVRAYINGRPAWLGVDSGAPVSAIAVHRREHVRLTPITAKSNPPAGNQANYAINKDTIAVHVPRDGITPVDAPVVT